MILSDKYLNATYDDNFKRIICCFLLLSRCRFKFFFFCVCFLFRFFSVSTCLNLRVRLSCLSARSNVVSIHVRLVSVRACVHCICRCQHGAVIRAQTDRRARQGQTAGNCIAAEFERKRHGPWLLAFDFLFFLGETKQQQQQQKSEREKPNNSNNIRRKQGKNCLADRRTGSQTYSTTVIEWERNDWRPRQENKLGRKEYKSFFQKDKLRNDKSNGFFRWQSIDDMKLSHVWYNDEKTSPGRGFSCLTDRKSDVSFDVFANGKSWLSSEKRRCLTASDLKWSHRCKRGNGSILMILKLMLLISS